MYYIFRKSVILENKDQKQPSGHQSLRPQEVLL